MVKKQFQPKVFYCTKGFANFYDDHIEINYNLRKNKRLRDYVMKHELGHKKEFDILHEFKIDWKIVPALIYFVITNPSTWRDFSPIQIRNKKIIYDINLIILYITIILLGIISIKIFF